MEPGTWSQGCLGAARLRATNRACRSADRLTSVLGQLGGAAECGIRRPLPTHLPTCRIPALPAASLLELSEPPPTSRPDLSLCWTIPPSTASPWPAPPVQEASLVLSHLSCGHFISQGTLLSQIPNSQAKRSCHLQTGHSFLPALKSLSSCRPPGPPLASGSSPPLALLALAWASQEARGQDLSPPTPLGQAAPGLFGVAPCREDPTLQDC